MLRVSGVSGFDKGFSKGSARLRSVFVVGILAGWLRVKGFAILYVCSIPYAISFSLY